MILATNCCMVFLNLLRMIFKPRQVEMASKPELCVLFRRMIDCGRLQGFRETGTNLQNMYHEVRSILKYNLD